MQAMLHPYSTTFSRKMKQVIKQYGNKEQKQVISREAFIV